MEQDFIINYHITEDQAKTICAYMGKEFDDLEEYEICELLDQIIDNLVN